MVLPSTGNLSEHTLSWWVVLTNTMGHFQVLGASVPATSTNYSFVLRRPLGIPGWKASLCVLWKGSTALISVHQPTYLQTSVFILLSQCRPHWNMVTSLYVFVGEMQFLHMHVPQFKQITSWGARVPALCLWEATSYPCMLEIGVCLSRNLL